MKYRITYIVFNSVEFYAEAGSTSKAYEYIRAIVNDKKILFPDPEETLSDYMDILYQLKTGMIDSYSNFLFKIEVIKSA